VIRVYYDAGNVIETHEQTGDLKEEVKALGAPQQKKLHVSCPSFEELLSLN